MRRHRPYRRLLGTHPIGYLLVVPYIAFFLGVIAYPLIFAVYLSFHEWTIVSVDKPFVGLDNYVALYQDDVFWTAIGNMLRFLVVDIPITVVAALLLAVALDTSWRGRAFFRASYFLPYVTSGVVIALIWKGLYSSQGGGINSLLGALGLPQIAWLTSTFWAMPSIAIMVAWKQMGFFIVLYLAGLQGIPRHLYEAATVDGAGVVQRFWYVTLPQLRPITVLVVLLSTIQGFQLFGEPYIMTGGGPLNSSLSVVLYIYQTAFQSLRFGYAAAMGVVLAAIIMITTLIQRRLLRFDGA